MLASGSREPDGYRALPEVFVGAKTDEEREQERLHLEDAVDLIIERLPGGARSVLWVITRAGEPVSEEMIPVLLGEPRSEALAELCACGLLARDGGAYAFHELVAERAAAWMDEHPDERGGKTEADIWAAYGAWYGARFEALVAAAKRELASEAGRRGIRYLLRARAFERLGHLANEVVSGTHDPTLLGEVIADLQAVADEVPAGQARWIFRTNLATALRQAGRPDQALSLYAQAAEEAEAAEHRAHLGWIYGGWAGALGMVGQLERARETYLKSAEAMARSGQARADILGMELEALRVDVEQGRAEEALPAIEAKLGEVRAWWASRQRGEPVPEAPEDALLARTLLIGLEIACHTHRALERWQPSLDLLGELEQVQRDLGAGEHEVARMRVNRYGPLMALGDLAEARAVLKGCLDVFHRVDDVTNEAIATSALADVWNELGDPTQAIALERRALAVCDRLPLPGDRAASHHNLVNYLHAAGTPAEAPSHQLAALVYLLVTGLDSRIYVDTLVRRVHESAARNETFTLPPLSTLLADPAFSALRTYLTTAAVDLPDLQACIDDIFAAASATLSAPE
jgi:tetratricopeptide (TPR) repeat protein